MMMRYTLFLDLERTRLPPRLPGSPAFSMRRLRPTLPSLSRRARPCPFARSESVASGEPSLSGCPLSMLVCLHLIVFLPYKLFCCLRKILYNG